MSVWLVALVSLVSAFIRCCRRTVVSNNFNFFYFSLIIKNYIHSIDGQLLSQQSEEKCLFVRKKSIKTVNTASGNLCCVEKQAKEVNSKRLVVEATTIKSKGREKRVFFLPPKSCVWFTDVCSFVNTTVYIKSKVLR